MMDKADRIDRVEHDLEDRSANPAPIIIVQRGRATWGRELLLLLLLLATASYILYQEYRGPSIIVRSTLRDERRVVDSVPVASISSGNVVLRGSEGQGEVPEAPTDRLLKTTSEDAIEATRTNDHPGEGDLGKESDSDRLDGESTLLAENEAHANDSPAVDPFGFPDPVADRAEPIHENLSNPRDAEGPRRASAVIVWDQDRRDRPLGEPRAEEDRPDDRMQGDRDEDPRSSDEPKAREISIQTDAQRRHFLQCLALAIRQYGRQAGPHIEGLCRDYRIPLPSEVVQLEQRYGTNVFLAGGDLEQTITSLRRIGAPESYLLEQLSEQMARAIGARHGPRNAMEARVFAARKLLTIPLPDRSDRQAAARPSIGG